MNRKLGVIVPFRNRYGQICEFIERITVHLNKNKIPFELIFIKQDDAKLFNRGMLLNIGFKQAQKLECDYVVFHDIDMLPIDVDYSYVDHPVHLATNFKDNERVLFDTYFGGVTLFPMNDFKRINGYSNKYWGWGYEDDDLLLRCVKHDIELDTLKLTNSSPNGKSLKFNGIDSYVKGINDFRMNQNVSFFVSFYPDDIICDHTKDSDDYNVFTIPGYDFAISYNSFSRYNFVTFDRKQNVLYVNSKIKKNYKTNIGVTVDNVNKIIKVYQDGEFIGEINSFENLHQYNKEPFFYLGVGDPNREHNPKYFKGYIDYFITFSDVIEEKEIKEMSKNKYGSLTQNFGDYKSANLITLYYDARYVREYRLMDLSGNNNRGEIVNCEIVDVELPKYTEIKVPHRRDSLFESLPHEENGFFENKWKDQCTRWNQLRFINEVTTNHSLLFNDGLSDLEYIEHGKITADNVTHINVGI